MAQRPTSTPSAIDATTRDRERVISAIVLAFVDDPVARWAWPEPHAYLTYFTNFTNVFGGKAFDHGTAHSVAEFSGGALWLPPGVQPDSVPVSRARPRSAANTSEVRWDDSPAFSPAW
jgi:hypothetical protein